MSCIKNRKKGSLKRAMFNFGGIYLVIPSHKRKFIKKVKEHYYNGSLDKYVTWCKYYYIRRYKTLKGFEEHYEKWLNE